MEPILPYLVRRLQEAGRHRWKAIAAEAGVSPRIPEKLVYGERNNPTLQNVQPLLDLFAAVDRGERELPAATHRSREPA